MTETTHRNLTDVSVTVNGTPVTATVESRTLLVHFLRQHAGLTGTHWGCDTSNCGACVVWLDRAPVKSCTVLAAMASGHEVTTVEGLETADGLDPLQEGFMQCHGLQCGFCTPGMLMVGKALLEENPDPSESEIREAISGNLCRCTGYENIVRSIRWAADRGAGAGRDAEGTDLLDGAEDVVSGSEGPHRTDADEAGAHRAEAIPAGADGQRPTADSAGVHRATFAQGEETPS